MCIRDRYKKEIRSDENQSIETMIEDDKQKVETLNKITEIEIIPNDQIREPVNQKIEGSKEIENKKIVEDKIRCEIIKK